MNILNENEAIVINSLENWEKVAEILDRDGYDFADSPVSKLVVSEFDISFYLRVCKGKSLGWGSLHFLKKKYPHYSYIQDTEFIAKHSKNTDMDDVRPPKQDKNMKIVVKKENGLLEVEQTYELEIHPDNANLQYCRDSNTSVCFLHTWQVEKWLENGYIEEVKEVSYRFEDIVSTTDFSDCPIACVEVVNEKQQAQIMAFGRLTHVRAKILKDHGYSEDWEAKIGEDFWNVEYSKANAEFNTSYYSSIVDGLQLNFPTRELAELALQHNQELFKTCLGV